ncbi:MAG: GLPGLI family protein [Rhodothermaceae bacterium]|nr:GLPGLI family protein [Rhodothermaceae bacterium]MXZ57671.1 GLPGLI family protein [Rhodothermaceae bacterium]MYB91331.1 GLPGLI family protein [Rhodothermaceae bacterium]MYD68772.1 GLPGLI family protein [Rhodothermaceae bacterium]MYG45426.1 GLPGLI family protein [Rhodothermaceae bacterium]
MQVVHPSLFRKSISLWSLTALTIFLVHFCAAQSGTVTYTRTIKLDIELPPEMARFQDMIPKADSSLYSMDFNNAFMASIRRVEADDKANGTDFGSSTADGVTIRMRFSGLDGNSSIPNLINSVTDIDEGLYTDHYRFLGRDFLITGELPLIKWKLSTEEGSFLDRRVIKATATVDSVSVDAWFTPEIPVPLGPEHYGGLPGLILVLSIDDGRKMYEANSITMDTEVEITTPEKGRKMTQEEFDALVKERMEEGVSGAARSIIIRQ